MCFWAYDGAKITAMSVPRRLPDLKVFFTVRASAGANSIRLAIKALKIVFTSVSFSVAGHMPVTGLSWETRFTFTSFLQ